MSAPFPEDYIFDPDDAPSGSGWTLRPLLDALEAGRPPSGFLEFFDRDPERTPPPGDDLLLAPADGLVELLAPKGEAPARFVVHLRLTDVHVQRAPLAGRVLSVDRSGEGHYYPDDPRYWNGVQATTRVLSRFGPYAVRQMTTLLTRRLETYLEPGAEVAAGQRLGRIRFGSTVILELPRGARFETLVRTRQKVRAGETPLARLAAAAR